MHKYLKEAENKRRRKHERASQEEDQEERKTQKGSTSREDNHNLCLSRQVAEGNIDEVAGESQMDL